MEPRYIPNPNVDNTWHNRLLDAWGIGDPVKIPNPNFVEPYQNPYAGSVFSQEQLNREQAARELAERQRLLQEQSAHIAQMQYDGYGALMESEPQVAQMMMSTPDMLAIDNNNGVAPELTLQGAPQPAPTPAPAPRPAPQPAPAPRPAPRPALYNGVPIHQTAAAAKAGEYVRIGREIYYKRPDGGYVLVSRGG